MWLVIPVESKDKLPFLATLCARTGTFANQVGILILSDENDLLCQVLVTRFSTNIYNCSKMQM